MYRPNNLKRITLISTEEVIYHAPTKHTIDPRSIEQSIIIAEERFAVQVLGYPFYLALASEKNRTVDAANKIDLQAKVGGAYTLNDGDLVNASEFLSVKNKALWDHILWKFIAECVMLTAAPEGFVQFGTEGVFHQQATSSPMGGGGVVTPELRSMKWAMDKKMFDRIDPLKAAVHNFVCRFKSDYPLYENPCDCDQNGTPYKRRTDVALGIYDDEPNKCGCNEETHWNT
ncbi:hypothetical protein ACLOAU_14685 [Niabella sp. CJ426]|uniref:hypothetical protein n=1 Tax=Niabella sp. CJ426 TaxID=3393740 RepID=UPI003D06B59C